MRSRSSVVAVYGPAVAVKRACALVLSLIWVCFAQRAEAQTLAQLTLPGMTATTAPSSIRQAGIYLTAPVTLDGSTLFTIASSALASPSQLSLQQRLADIQTALDELVATNDVGRAQPTDYDPRSLRVHIVHHGDLESLQAVDAKHSDPLPIVTVTSTDARYNGASVADLAEQWQGVLQSGLTRSLQLRQPAVQRRSAQNVVRVAGALAVLTLIVSIALTALRRRTERLAADLDAREREAAATAAPSVTAERAPEASQRRHFLALALRSLEPGRRLRFYRAIAETGVWLLLVLWLCVLVWAFSLFPQTTPLSAAFLHGAIVVVSAIFITGLINRVLDIVIARLASASRFRTAAKAEDRARRLLRVPTIAAAISGSKTFLLVFITVLSVLGQLGVPITSVVTIGGLVAIALSFAVQSLIRDFVTGFLVLFEDHYVVGDYVGINAYSGLVERLTLRMVQIRDVTGDLITIPHSSVTSAVNMSRDWSRVDFRVPVDPSADVPKALALVRAALESLATDSTWRDAVVDPVEWLGIDELSKDWVIVRASIKTAPLRQFELRREINARVEAAFRDGGIAYGAQIPGIA